MATKAERVREILRAIGKFHEASSKVGSGGAADPGWCSRVREEARRGNVVLDLLFENLKMLRWCADVFGCEPDADHFFRHVQRWHAMSTDEKTRGLGNGPLACPSLHFTSAIGLRRGCQDTWTQQLERWAEELERLDTEADLAANLPPTPVPTPAQGGKKGKGGSPPENLGAPETQTTTPPQPLAMDVRDKVFISYSHKDEKFLNELLTHLKPLLRAGSVSAWSDKQIQPGSEWLKDIKEALRLAKVAVLLVTKDFLASDFIHEHELGPLLKTAKQGGVRILWVPVRACAYKESPLKDLQAVISLEKPLAEMRAERDRAWVKICEAIKKATTS